jgi:ABC-type sugar transport system substrate-binding protein
MECLSTGWPHTITRVLAAAVAVVAAAASVAAAAAAKDSSTGASNVHGSDNWNNGWHP